MKPMRSILFLTLASMLYAGLFGEAMRAYKSGNFKEAKALFEQAIEEDGAQQANFFLGILYMRGQGTQKDLKLAKHYLEVAALNGNGRANCYLAEIYLEGKKQEKALPLLREGLKKGAQECQGIANKYKLSL